MGTLFKLEALSAKHGDCLILHYGPKDKPLFIVIDGGPAGVYTASLKKRLDQLKKLHSPEKPLPLQMVMVSHIDDDHINGVLQMANELVKKETADDDTDPPPYRMLTLWHNSFEDITGDAHDAQFSALNASVAAASAGGELIIPAGLNMSVHGGLVAASVGQGRKLRDQAKKLNASVNTHFQGPVAAPAQGAKLVPWGNGLEFIVVGPKKPQLDALKADWTEKVKKAKGNNASVADLQAMAAAYVDDSVYNLSSIVVLARAGGKTMLLTGDARGDFILDGLSTAGLLKNGAIHVNLLKLPHHGSDRDVTTDFFRQVTADHYVVSGDGKYDNPEIETLNMIAAARTDDHFTLHLTNRTGQNELGEKLKGFLHTQRDNGRQFGVEYREETKLSLEVDLSTP